MEIDLVSLVEKDDFYEHNFYPERAFVGESHVLLYRKESWGNLEYLWHFYKCDKQNIRTIVYTPLNLFPLASLCSHTCRMMKTDVLSTFYSSSPEFLHNNTYYNYRHREAFRYFNVPKWDIFRAAEGQVDRSYTKNELQQAVDHCTQRHLCIDKAAFEQYQKASALYKEGAICVERRKGNGGRSIEGWSKIGNALGSFGTHVVGHDFAFQRAIIEQYKGHDCYLSFQILASLFNKCAFVGMAGAGSLFTLALPINAILIIDTEFNTPEMHRLCKSKYNKELFNVPTLGFPMEQTVGEAFYSGERWTIVEEAFKSIGSIVLPKVQINQLLAN